MNFGCGYLAVAAAVRRVRNYCVKILEANIVDRHRLELFKPHASSKVPSAPDDSEVFFSFAFVDIGFDSSVVFDQRLESRVGHKLVDSTWGITHLVGDLVWSQTHSNLTGNRMMPVPKDLSSWQARPLELRYVLRRKLSAWSNLSLSCWSSSSKHDNLGNVTFTRRSRCWRNSRSTFLHPVTTFGFGHIAFSYYPQPLIKSNESQANLQSSIRFVMLVWAHT